MENFQLASKQKLRFQTTKGSLSTEQLWDLSITELDDLAVSLEKEYKDSAKKSFVIKKSEKDKTTKLRFDICLEILDFKVDEQNSLREVAEKKEHNAKIIQLISEKQDDALKGKSIKELEGMLQ
jgi:hypothetical protein